MSAKKFLHRTLLVMISGSGLTTETARGHGMIPMDVPVERLVINLGKYIAEHPDDADGYYRLGRVHTLALETKTEFALTFESSKLLRPAEGSWAKRDWGRDEHAKPSTPQQIKQHLIEAIKNLNKAIELDPAEARYRLTLACALEAGAALKSEVDVWPMVPTKTPIAVMDEEGSARYFLDKVQVLAERPEELDSIVRELRESNWMRRVRDVVISEAYKFREKPEYKDIISKLREIDWQEQIEEQFFVAMCYSLPLNGKADTKPIWGGMEDWTSYEAAKDFVRVVEARKSRNSDQIRLKVAKETIKAFDSLPDPGGITPIVLSFESHRLSELVSDQAVPFNLDGTDRPQAWSWVRPDTAILVWDPGRTGTITSGRQLFGSVTWWLFWDNGYHALDALDDNRDGELAGSELDGLAVWRDANSNGVSDPGEVVPIASAGIAGISCRALSEDQGCPSNPIGLRMADGRVLPTYDWIASPVPSESGVRNKPLLALATIVLPVPIIWFASARRRIPSN